MVLIIGYYCFNNNSETVIEEYEENVIISDNKIEEDNEKITIYIIGEVNKPGVYELPENSRIIDAVKTAEGSTELANLDNINLAYLLSDGQKIKIPSINDENNDNNISENDETIFDNPKDDKVNINTASIKDLEAISGIGESTAKRIIEYRNEFGKFNSIEDIKDISGIGEKKYNLIKDYIKTK